MSMQILSNQREINYYPWERSLAEKDINEKVYIFAKTIKNLVSHFIPRQKVLCDEKYPPWISNKIKKLINEKK